MASSDAENLRFAILSLYGLAGQAQQQANNWLNAFARSPAAWEACMQLLDPSERPEVCFFCANMLLSKVRSEWHKLSADQQQQMSGVISNKFQLFVNQTQAKHALQRLGLLLAAVASLSGAQACSTFAGQCVGMISGGGGVQSHMSECALSMLTAFAEEVQNMDKGRRKDLVTATTAQWAAIAGLADKFIPEQMTAGNYGLVTSALLCLQSWLRMSSDPSSTCRMSPGVLAANHPQLLSCLFSLLGATATEPVTAERIECLACEILCELLGPGTFGADAQQERATVESATGALLLLRDAALAPGPGGAGVARCVASIASALAQRDTEAVCGSSAAAAALAGTAPASNGNAAAAGKVNGQHVLPLAELMLHCIARQERAICEAAVEYFLCVNTLPTEERHPQMAGPLYASLLDPLLKGHACYSASFTSWNEEIDDDEEAFHRFRDQSLTELLETVYLMTGPAYMQRIQDSVSTAAQWQQAEGALFCLKAVAGPIRSQIGSSSYVHAQQTGELLLALFEDLCNPTGRAAASLSSPYTCATAAALVGSYAAWFDSTPAAPLEGALRLLLHALCFPYSWHPAANSFKVLCMRCAARLASAPVLQSLAAVAASAIAPVPPPGQVAAYVHMPLEDRQAVVEGLARIITFLNPQDVTDGALNIQQPHLTRTQAIVTHGSSTVAQAGPAAKQLLQQLAEELQLMAILIKGLEFPGQPSPGFAHPAMKLLEAAWPVLTAVADAPVCRQDRVVMEALCEVHKRAVQTARGAAKPLLITLLNAVDNLFKVTQLPASLDVLSTITEVFGEVKGQPDIAAAQKQAFEEASARAGAFLMEHMASNQLAASGDLLRSLLAVGDAHLVFARELFFSSPAIPQLFQWAVVAAAMREKDPVNAAFSFLSHFLAAAGKVFTAAAEAAAAGAAATAEQQAAAAAATHLQQCIAGHGERLTQTLVLAACDTAPRQLLRALAGVLYQLLQPSLTGAAGKQWLMAALQAQDLPGMSAGLLKSSDCEAFAKLALREPPLTRGRFDALLMDFAAIPRGEGTSDALLAYEL